MKSNKRKYPFPPELLDVLPEELIALFLHLELVLLEEICSQLQSNSTTDKTILETMMPMRSGGNLDGITTAIQETVASGAEKLDEIINWAIDQNHTYYTEIANLTGTTMPENFTPDVTAIIEQTKSTYDNIVQSIGFLVDGGRTILKPIDAYRWAANNAILQIQSGAINYNEAIKNAVKQLADSGIKTVKYESGHVDQIDVAVRRTVMTGVNQLCQGYAEQANEYFNTDLVEVSAHIGARNQGTGPQNHESWQGFIYRWREKPRTSIGNYPDFIKTTGYGTGEGLGGWNCRHHFTTFIEGVMERTYTDDQLEAMKGKNRAFVYEGKDYDGYTATQKQRQIERTIRKLEREKTGYEAAELKDDARAISIKIQRLERKYKAFSKEAGLQEQTERAKSLYIDDATEEIIGDV